MELISIQAWTGSRKHWKEVKCGLCHRMFDRCPIPQKISVPKSVRKHCKLPGLSCFSIIPIPLLKRSFHLHYCFFSLSKNVNTVKLLVSTYLIKLGSDDSPLACSRIHFWIPLLIPVTTEQHRYIINVFASNCTSFIYESSFFLGESPI